jgi:hypothetical protein
MRSSNLFIKSNIEGDSGKSGAAIVDCAAGIGVVFLMSLDRGDKFECEGGL